MKKTILKRLISFTLVFAMLCTTGLTVLAYGGSAGEENLALNIELQYDAETKEFNVSVDENTAAALENGLISEEKFKDEVRRIAQEDTEFMAIIEESGESLEALIAPEAWFWIVVTFIATHYETIILISAFTLQIIDTYLNITESISSENRGCECDCSPVYYQNTYSTTTIYVNTGTYQP